MGQVSLCNYETGPVLIESKQAGNCRYSDSSVSLFRFYQNWSCFIVTKGYLGSCIIYQYNGVISCINFDFYDFKRGASSSNAELIYKYSSNIGCIPFIQYFLDISNSSRLMAWLHLDGIYESTVTIKFFPCIYQIEFSKAWFEVGLQRVLWTLVLLAILA